MTDWDEIRVPYPAATAAALAERNVFVSARGEGLTLIANKRHRV